MNGGRTFYRSFPAEADPQRLLDPEEQRTAPSGDHEHGHCEKCGGSGSVIYNCCSCLEGGSQPFCLACEGRVRFCEACPTCLGLGDRMIDRTVRRGIAVLPTRQGLYRYLAAKSAPLGGKVVLELEGPLSDDLDLDADSGVLLIHPQRVVSVEPLNAGVVFAIQRRGIAVA